MTWVRDSVAVDIDESSSRVSTQREVDPPIIGG